MAEVKWLTDDECNSPKNRELFEEACQGLEGRHLKRFTGVVLAEKGISPKDLVVGNFFGKEFIYSSDNGVGRFETIEKRGEYQSLIVRSYTMRDNRKGRKLVQPGADLRLIDESSKQWEKYYQICNIASLMSARKVGELYLAKTEERGLLTA